jgi:hypothetical protein
MSSDSKLDGREAILQALRQVHTGLVRLIAAHRRQIISLIAARGQAPRQKAKMIMPAKMFSAMGVWTSLEPQLTTPTPSPSPQEGGSPLSSRP